MAVLLALAVGGSDENDKISNSLNEINSGISDINSGIGDMNNFMQDGSYNQDDITSNMPSNSDVSDITAESLDQIFNNIKDAFTSSSYKDVEIKLPFVKSGSIVIPADLTSKYVPSIILNLVQMFYWFLISRFIYKDVTNYIDKLKSGDVFNGTDTNIKADML